MPFSPSSPSGPRPLTSTPVTEDLTVTQVSSPHRPAKPSSKDEPTELSNRVSDDDITLVEYSPSLIDPRIHPGYPIVTLGLDGIPEVSPIDELDDSDVTY